MRDRREGAHRGGAVVGIGAVLRLPLENGAGKLFELQPVRVGVLPEGAAVDPVFLREALDVARLVIPDQPAPGEDAAVLADGAEPELDVAALRYAEIEVAEATVGVLDGDEPAMGTGAQEMAGADRGDLPPGEAGDVEGVGAVRHQQVAPAVRPGIDPGPPRTFAGGDHGQQVVRHGVAVGRVVVPHLDRDPLPHLRGDEVPGEAEAGVEAPVVADLEGHPGLADAGAKLLALLDGGAERLLDEDVLARSDRFKTQRDVERVAGGDDDGLHPGVGEHAGVVAVGHGGLVHRGHFFYQVLRGVADGVELGVARLAAGLEVGHLGDRAAAENADAQEPVLTGTEVTGHCRAPPAATGGRATASSAPRRGYCRRAR